MAPWEICVYNFPVEGAHPCVIFQQYSTAGSPCFRPRQRLLVPHAPRSFGRELKPAEILLNSADGLDWEMLCRVDALHFVLKSGLRDRRGVVCKERRRLICQRMMQVFPFEF